jgi:cobalt-zinc-cadmium efflux system protein
MSSTSDSHSHTIETTKDRQSHQTKLIWTFVLVSLFMVAEVVGGILSNSLALLADAGHMLSDSASLALAIFAFWISRKDPNTDKTYGYYRAEILAALVNGATLLAISGYIYFEAYGRFSTAPEIKGPLMMGVAVGGLLVNLVSLWVLHGGHDENLNVKGVWLHVLGDTLGSFGAILAGGGIWLYGWWWLDPLASVVIASLILFSAWELVKRSVSVLMEASPGHIDVDEVHLAIRSIELVDDVHDLHVWSISSGIVALSAHVTIDDLENYTVTLENIRKMFADEFDINHSTIQIETPSFDEQEHHDVPI